MSKFKVGDEVVCTQEGYFLGFTGTIFTPPDSRNPYYLVRSQTDFSIVSFFESELKFSNETKAQSFEVGDRVRIIGDEEYNGKEGVIEFIDPVELEVPYYVEMDDDRIDYFSEEEMEHKNKTEQPKSNYSFDTETYRKYLSIALDAYLKAKPPKSCFDTKATNDAVHFAMTAAKEFCREERETFNGN